MSWIDRLLPRIHKSDSEHPEKKESVIPEGLWTKCPMPELRASALYRRIA